MTHLELLYAQREDCLKALHEVLRSGQSVEIEGMKITRADITKIRSMLNDIDNEIAELERQKNNQKRSRIRVVVPT